MYLTTESKRKENVDLASGIIIQVGKMCEAMDRIAEKRAVETRIENAKKMIARGKLTLEEIAEDSGLPLEKVKELADKRTA